MYLSKQKELETRLRIRQRDWRVAMLHSAAERAKKKQLEFSITKEDIIIPEYCPILGYKLAKNLHKPKYDSATLDRIDSNKGYTKNNIQVICHKANTLKRDANLEELKKIVAYMEAANS